jgi:cell division protein FtsB
MEGMNIVEILLVICVAVSGWFLRTLYDSHRQLERDVSDHKNEVAKNYVVRDDLRLSVAELKSDMKEGFNKINATLSLIFIKLDGKADKQ